MGISKVPLSCNKETRLLGQAELNQAKLKKVVSSLVCNQTNLLTNVKSVMKSKGLVDYVIFYCIIGIY